MIRPRDGDQLLLEGLELTALARVPWEGRSPRVLTAGYVRFTLKTQVGKSMGDFVRTDQLELFREHQKGLSSEVARGAPTLLPLKEASRDV